MHDLIGSADSANLDLEIQLTESSNPQTVVSQEITITADLID